MLYRVTTRLVALLAALAVLPLGEARIVSDCSGCLGTVDPGAVFGSSGSGCPGTLFLSVLMDDGLCVDPAPPATECVAEGCEVTVVRTWSGAIPGATVDICNQLVGVGTRCEDPAPIVDASGSGSKTAMYVVGCGTSWTWSLGLSCIGGGVFVGRSGACSKCS